jgi:hypothetical protein
VTYLLVKSVTPTERKAKQFISTAIRREYGLCYLGGGEACRAPSLAGSQLCLPSPRFREGAILMVRNLRGTFTQENVTPQCIRLGSDHVLAGRRVITICSGS